MDDPVRIARVGDHLGELVGDIRRRSAWDRSITPPSEVIRPQRQAGLTFLRATAGRSNGEEISSFMASLSRLGGMRAQPTGAAVRLDNNGEVFR